MARLSAGHHRAEVNGGAKADGYAVGVNRDVENGAGVTTTVRRLYPVGVRHDF